MKKLATVGVLLLALAFWGCGGEDDESTITANVEDFYAAFSTGDGNAACALLTDDAAADLAATLSVTEGTECAPAVEGAISDDSTKEVEALQFTNVEEVRISGDTASVQIDTLDDTVDLEKTDDGWRISDFGL